MSSLNQLNTQVRIWTDKTTQDLKDEFDNLDIKHEDRSPNPSASKDDLKAITGQSQGIIRKISFKFRRSMVFVSKGVGRGVPASKAGTSATKRKQKDWFNPTIDKNIDDLADTVSALTGDNIVNNLRIN